VMISWHTNTKNKNHLNTKISNPIIGWHAKVLHQECLLLITAPSHPPPGLPPVKRPVVNFGKVRGWL
jgi:hypothetical protein